MTDTRSETLAMDFLEEVKYQFEEISRELIGDHLHCRFVTFDHLGPTWKRRVELRKLLVKDLESYFKNLSQKERENLLIPGRRPPLSNISISHCPLLGGFIFSLDNNIALGLDIEKADRVGRSVQHLSTREEVNQSPSEAFLWVAKEAAFKCIPDGGSQHFLRDLFIFDWKKIKMEGYQFRFQVKKKNHEGKGVAFLANGLAFGYTQLM